MLISIDPGVRMSGVAVFEDAELVVAWLQCGEDWNKTSWGVMASLHERFPAEVLQIAHLAIEKPQIYERRKTDPNDLVELALCAGAIVGRLHPDVLTTTYWPHDWKGSVPKGIMVKRIQSRLSEDERQRVELPRAKSYQHNVWDAVGIGLHHERKARRGRKSAEKNNHLLRSRKV